MGTAIRNIPDVDELIKNLREAALRQDSIDAFISYLFESLSPYIQYNKAGVMTLHMASSSVNDMIGLGYKLDPRMASHYKKVAKCDFFSPLLWSDDNRFTKVLHAWDYVPGRDWDAFSDTVLYKNYCRPFDVLDNIASAARFPNHKDKVMVLILFKSEPRRYFTKDDICLLEKIFPSLFYMWLYRTGRICSETMTERLGMVDVIESLRNAPRLLELARLVAQEPAATSKEYAKELSPKSGNSEDTLSWKTVSNELGMLCEKLKVPRDAINRKRLLHKRVRFLEDI